MSWTLTAINSMQVLIRVLTLCLTSFSFHSFGNFYSFSLWFCPSSLSCHGSRAENSHLGCWCEQSQWSDWMVQLLLPWQLLPQRCLWNQAALDGCYCSRTLWNGKHRMSRVLKILNEVKRCLYYWGISSKVNQMHVVNYYQLRAQT